MTNVLMGAYPDLFAAGSLFSGVPYGCFAGPNAWNTQCALGQLIKTPQQWVRSIYSQFLSQEITLICSTPGRSSSQWIPRLHRHSPQGSILARNSVRRSSSFLFFHHLPTYTYLLSSDTTLYPQNFWEEIKQWTNVFGVSQTPTSNTTNDPLPRYSRASFGPDVQGILAQGVGHTVPEQENDVMVWFGLSTLTPGSGGGGSAPPPPTTTAASPTSTSNPAGPTGVTAPEYAQCGGIGFTGPTGMFVLC